MSRQPVSEGGRADAAEFRNELLGRLGVRPEASDADVEAAHNGLVEFLELAPQDVKSWAATQTANVDEAFALLSGPEEDLIPAAQVAAMPQVNLNKTSPAPAPSASATTAPAPAAPSAAAASWLPTALVGNKPLQKKIGMVAAALLVAGIGFGVYSSGKSSDVPGFTGTPTGTETTAAASAAKPVDPAKVAALTAKVTANPKDVASLQSLGDMYFAATDYKNTLAWENKVLAVEPKNKVALLAAGAAQFNLGNQPGAKKTWTVAAGLYPNEAEVHYDLGFLYMSQTPPDTVNMQAEWKKVVAIDPNSNLAKTVQTHIKGTKTPAATAAPTK